MGMGVSSFCLELSRFHCRDLPVDEGLGDTLVGEGIEQALDQAKAEMAAKLKALQDQTKGVDERAKARIERRIADLKANFNLRSSKLSQASALTNER